MPNKTIHTMEDVMHPGTDSQDSAAFPDAPAGWDKQHAVDYARTVRISLHDDHWELIRALQNYFLRHESQSINRRDLHDALDEHFHIKGGLKYLYELIPSGPVATGCHLAGLEAPAGSVDRGFGSVV